MKVLRIFEKVVFILACVVGIVGIAFSPLLDETAGYPGAITSTAFFAAGGLSVILAIAMSAVFYFSKKEVAKRIADALAITAFTILFAGGLIGLSSAGGLTPTFIFVAAILFIISLIFRLIIWIAIKVKPDLDQAEEPENDPKVRAILKWKRLMEEEVITKEEYEAKRKAIVESMDVKKK